MNTPQRTITHQIDTLAVRRLMSSLNANWVIRDLAERDYGIDLSVEYFDGVKTTGKTAYLQVKGTNSVIPKKTNGKVCFYTFPVKTLLYAEQFPEPFFLIYLSTIPNEPIYFVWLQKYCQIVLDAKMQNWRNETSVNIHIPIDHTFQGQEARVLKIASQNVMMKLSMNFLSDFYFWQQHIEALIEDGDMSCRKICIKFIRKFLAYDQFFIDLELLDLIDENLNFNQAISDITALQNVYSDHEIRDSLRTFSLAVSGVAESILTKSSLEEFIYEDTGELSY